MENITPKQQLEDELKKETASISDPTPEAPKKRGRPRKTEAEKAAAREKRNAARRAARAAKRAAAQENDGVAQEKEPVAQKIVPTGAEKSVPEKTVTKTAATAAAKMAATERDLIFALDIGTRSVIGIVAEEQPDGKLGIIATTRQEHRTRAMLDGQIHDVPQVAAVIRSVKEKLEAEVGPLRSAAVAAAGRALYTMTATAEKTFGGVITTAAERDLDFAGVQAAQAKLAASHTVDDPTHYYCVGYSTIHYALDGIPLKSLVGQRGDQATAEVIATFLPRQVIDSMQSALAACDLEMRALTLEPIAAINVLIPPTMRHLNLVLVDIGAGTSDVAITKNGSVIAYGMVPKAGDEITEAISQNFLLDFNVAEAAKRAAAHGEKVAFSDILGASYDLAAADIIKPVLPSIRDLATSIAGEITRLNGEAPQAVMLVGGGSLTPMLKDYVSEALEMAPNRVAVRQPVIVGGIEEIPEALQSPDAVTPLGILKIASMNTLHFLRVRVNGQEHSLFNFRELTVSDALLASGIHLRKWNGRPGLALMVTVDGRHKSFPGTMGTLAKLTVDGQEADLDTPVHDGSEVTVTRGENGTTPELRARDVLAVPPALHITLNDRPAAIPADILVGGEKVGPDYILRDGDEVTSRLVSTVGETLRAAGCPPQGRRIHYTLNGDATTFVSSPTILLNDLTASLSLSVHDGDRLTYEEGTLPTLGAALHISELEASLVLYYQGEEHKIPSASLILEKDGAPARPDTQLTEGCQIRYEKSERRATTVSDALVAVGFEPPAASSRVSAQILVNGVPVDFTAPVKNGDTLAVKLRPLGGLIASGFRVENGKIEGPNENAAHASKEETDTPSATPSAKAPAPSEVSTAAGTATSSAGPSAAGTTTKPEALATTGTIAPSEASGTSVSPEGAGTAETAVTHEAPEAFHTKNATVADKLASAPEFSSAPASLPRSNVAATPQNAANESASAHGLNSLAEALGITPADVPETEHPISIPVPGSLTTNGADANKKPATITIADLMRND